MFESFEYFRPLYLFYIVSLLIIFLISMLQKKHNKIVSFSSVVIASCFATVTSLSLLYISGILVDELVMGGDATSTWMCIAVAAVSVINVIAYPIKHRG